MLLVRKDDSVPASVSRRRDRAGGHGKIFIAAAACAIMARYGEERLEQAILTACE